MATFIMTGRYSPEALKQISAERTKKGTKIIEQHGGKLVAGYAILGRNDLLIIVEFPGVSEVMKASIALNKALGITFATVPALPLEEFDKLVGAKS